MPILRRYAFGKDFAEADYHKWHKQLAWWVAENYPNQAKNDPNSYADKIITAALNGTKLDGTEWRSVASSFFDRVRTLCGFDLETGTGVRHGRHQQQRQDTRESAEVTKVLPPIPLRESVEQRNQYIKDLLVQYPHLDNPVYKPKVEELAETIIKSRMLSNDFILAKGKELESLSRIRESLHQQIGELMSFLEIAPSQRVKKVFDNKNLDVGSLINKLESYGETWKEYERLDALRELIQIYRMLKSKRPDGTEQLQAWECWHMTRSKPMKFTCECGKFYELIGGFEPEEIEAALIQAQKIYGFGLEAIGKIESDGISQAVLETGFTVNDVLESPQEEDPDGIKPEIP